MQKNINIGSAVLAFALSAGYLSGLVFFGEDMVSKWWLVLAFALIGAVFISCNWQSFLSQFQHWQSFEMIWFVVFLASLLILAFVWQDSVFGILTTIAGMLCVVLVAKGNIWNFFWGVINVVFYAIVSHENSYGGDFSLNFFYYLPMQFIGCYYWLKHYDTEDSEVIALSFLPKDWLISILVLGVGTFAISWFMPVLNTLLQMESNPLPLIDAFTTTGSIYAMFLMARRMKEQWLLWIVINVLSIVMWLRVGDMPMVVMWSAYLINSLYGYYNWNKLSKQHAEEAQTV